jgi:hypothetical protein
MQTLFQGMTDVATRCGRIRALIIETGIAEEIAGRDKRGRKKTFRECFEFVYAETL